MRYGPLARIAVDIRPLLAVISIAITFKLIYPQAFSWWWIGAGLIVWLAIGIILVSCYFDEISRDFEP
jgi:hypothetical protein